MNVNNPRKPDYVYLVYVKHIYLFILHPTKQPNPNEWYGILVGDAKNEVEIKKHQNNMINKLYHYFYSSYPKSQCFRTIEEAQNYRNNECK